MSDMSVSKQRTLDATKIPAPLEPSSQQPYYESMSYSRRGSATDPVSFYNYRRPSITDMSNLPLPNSTVVSRRESIATTTDYDYSSRSPSPSPFTCSNKRYHDGDAPHPYSLVGRRDSLPGHHPLTPSSTSHVYDSFQRRHSIASAEHHTNNNSRNNGNTKYRGNTN
jgi:hypothetical protein